MQQTKWNERLLASTRGQIISLLRTGPRIVNELAEALGLTDNAIRSHLATLQRDGLVVESGIQRGLRKPHALYALSAEAESLFPKRYGTLLNELLTVLEKNLAPKAFDKFVREVGRRLAAVHAPSVLKMNRKQRLDLAVEAMGELGGLARIEKRQGQLFVRGYGCPLAALVKDHPRACHLIETLLSELLGVPVQERCQREGKPQCLFEIRPKTP